MKKLLTFVMLSIYVFAFEPGQRMALNMKAGGHFLTDRWIYKNYINSALIYDLNNTKIADKKICETVINELNKLILNSDLYRNRERYYVSAKLFEEDHTHEALKTFLVMLSKKNSDSIGDYADSSKELKRLSSEDNELAKIIDYTIDEYIKNSDPEIIHKLEDTLKNHEMKLISDYLKKNYKNMFTDVNLEQLISDANITKTANLYYFGTDKNKLKRALIEEVEKNYRDPKSRVKTIVIDKINEFFLTKRYKFIVGFDFSEYLNIKLGDKIKKAQDGEILSSVSPTLVNGLGAKLHVDLYSGSMGNARIPIFLKAAATEYDTLDTKAKVNDSIMDYRGGLLNFRIDLWDVLVLCYDELTEFSNFDSYGSSLQLGVKYDQFSAYTNGVLDDNKTDNFITPYATFVLQTDQNLYSDENPLNKEGYLIMGLINSVQYLNNRINQHYLNSSNRTVASIEPYIKFYVSNNFSLDLRYTHSWNHSELEDRTYLSFSIER